MTREEFAQKIQWPYIISIFGLLNVAAMLPQLITILQNQSSEGVSVWMFIIYASIQLVLSLDAWIKRNKPVMITMGLSCLISIVLIGTILYFR